MKNWMNPTAAEEAARSTLRETPETRGQRALGRCLLLPAAGVLTLAAASICREAWALHWVYTPLMVLFVLALALAARGLGEKPWALWLLTLGAIGARAVFALGWTVYPHGDALTGWNLALELAAAPLGQWSSLTAALGRGIPLDVPFAVYEAMCIRLFGPFPAAVQLPGALWGGLSCLLTARMAQKLTGSRPAGLLAGTLLACCPTLLFAAGVLTVQPLYTLLVLTGLWLLLCRPLGLPALNEGLAGLAWGLGQVLRPGLPVPLLGLALWLLMTLPGRRREERLWPRTGALLGAFLAAFLALGLTVWGLTGSNALDAHLPARIAIGLNGETGGRFTEEDRPLLTGEDSPEEALAERRQGARGTLQLLLRKVRYQFGSYNYEAPRLDRGAALRSFLTGRAMHPLLQGYALVLLLLALAGIFSGKACRGRLLPAAALLGALVPAALLETDPVRNGAALPLFALWAAGPALKIAAWTALLVPAGRKDAPPLPPALAAVKLVLSAAVYAVLLGLVLVFFSGEGAFIYEAF